MNKKDRLRKNLYIFIFMNLSLVAFAIIYTVYFNHTRGSNREIQCIAKSILGIYCPGCGGSRSLDAFLRFDFVKSFVLYPAIPVSAVLVLIYDVRLVLTIIKRNTSYTDNMKFYSFILIPIVIISTFVVRNILLLCFKIDTIGDFIPIT